jgi:putative oxidoreductase
MARLLMRITLGGYFMAHGLQKLAGWFGGHGPQGTGQFFESVGLRPGKQQALAAGATETGGGALLALGLSTPAAVAALTAVMVSAIRHVHWRNGPWNANQGYELNAVVVAALAALAETGPGPLSLDRAFGSEVAGTPVALVALGTGLLGSLAASELGRRAAAATPTEPIRSEEPVAAAS